ncbi:hypothetical protein SAMN05421837_105641 [Amycolatopsis pretoriensis]|uniref:Lipoprotein n=1 Tax=Amycolatopsis pretoriensis TaxID=218821 RepID=A0A1H5R0X3_9PSEU|nr:hypothetical protein [Amycolatopsis pretoriensis]SEF31228.1 hypothetical protein SAMN05421837_105641 [Amycolatopsis pretoriensis]
MKRGWAGFLALALVLLSGCGSSTGFGTIVTSSAASAPPATSAAPVLRDVPPETHTGTGDGEFASTWPADQLGFFTFDCPKCSSNVMVDTDGGEYGLVNAIGKYKGTTWLNTEPDRPTRKVTIHANAPWTATIADYRTLPVAAPGSPVSGKGDAVFRVPDGVRTVVFTAKTRGNVAVWVHSEKVRDLLVNEIGDLSKTVEVVGPAYLLVEGYEASWTITPS